MSVLELRNIGGLEVFFRKPNMPTDNTKSNELEKTVKLITDENFEDYEGKYKRRLIHPENFEIIGLYKTNNEDEKYICLCSENTCSALMIVRHKPTKNFMAVGSVCYTRFNEENQKEVYHHCNSKKCNNCNLPLVFKANGKYAKNTDKKSNGYCFECSKIKRQENLKELMKKQRIYLKVEYEDKDEAKSLGAFWDAELKKWYAPCRSDRYELLIARFS